MKQFTLEYILAMKSSTIAYHRERTSMVVIS